ncbi:MAG: AMP-binding protein [Pseudomonadales bacterium]|nr:AMP-binding protein [Pseudomonadales bacterium]
MNPPSLNPPTKNLGSLLDGDPNRVALIDLTDGAQYTYAELDHLISSADISVASGERIGLLGSNSAAFMVTFSAIMRQGGVAVPINTKFPADTISHVIKDAELSSLWCDAELHPNVSADIPIREFTISGSNTSQSTTVVPGVGQPGLVLYTSGSTGTPKGVLLSHDSQWAMVSRMKGPVEGATGIIAAPLYHMNGLLFFWMLLAAGGTVVLMPRFSAADYLQAINDHQVNIITGVPTMLSLMLKEQKLINELDLDSVAAISVGSAPLSETLIEQVRGVFRKARIANGYGTTEAGAGMFGAHPDGIPVPPLSLGHPQSHVEIRLVGGASEGVLEVRTPAAMNGYLNLPAKTAEKMDDEGWINTGDIMRRDEDGFFYFVGRDDDMFNCGGENIYPGEVERILETDARIAESCVVPVADETKGQKPVAFIVVAVGATVTEQEIKDIALAKAPAYMHPRAVYFVESMPLAGTNKIDRKVLATLAAERASSNSK